MHEPRNHHADHAMAKTEARDPVCGMTVKPESPHRFEYHGTEYRFCSAKCLAKFQASPDTYLEPRAAEPARPGAIYTCPMHPEVVRNEPGNCPICGMALEPRNAVAEDSTELNDMTRRFWVSTALALPVFIMAMVSDLAPQLMPDFVSMAALQWLEFALATPVVLWAGWPIFRRGYESVINRSLNMFSLIALGVGAAWAYSVAGMLLPGIFPPAMRSMGGTVHVYFEAAAVIMALVLLGQVM